MQGLQKCTLYNIFEVNALQCIICKDVFHGSCLDIDESLLPFIYVIKEVGGWCCTSCRNSLRTARSSKGKWPTTTVSQQGLDVLTRELSDIKSSLLVVTQALQTASSNIVDLSQASSSDILPESREAGEHSVTSRLFSKVVSAGLLKQGGDGPANQVRAQPILHSQAIQPGARTSSNTTRPSSQLDANLRSAVLTAMHAELHTVSKRANYVVVSGLKSSSLASDADQFRDFSNDELKLNLNVRSAVGLGKPITGRIQPLLVALGTPEEVNTVMSRARDLRHSTSRIVRDNIFINRHQTRAEREAAFNARVLRRSRNSSDGSGSVPGLIGGEVPPSVAPPNESSSSDVPASPLPGTSSSTA